MVIMVNSESHTIQITRSDLRNSYHCDIGAPVIIRFILKASTEHTLFRLLVRRSSILAWLGLLSVWSNCEELAMRAAQRAAHWFQIGFPHQGSTASGLPWTRISAVVRRWSSSAWVNDWFGLLTIEPWSLRSFAPLVITMKGLPLHKSKSQATDTQITNNGQDSRGIISHSVDEFLAQNFEMA